jgi:hypothetical protein
MSNSQLYKLAEAARLSELDGKGAVAAMETGDRIASAVIWLMNSVKKLGS